MELVVPTWFKQRQAKAEPAGDGAFRLTAPNLDEAFIRIQQNGNGKWSAALRLGTEWPDITVIDPVYESPLEAWQGAFELYRRHVVT